jgi:Glycosyl hydrolases family 16
MKRGARQLRHAAAVALALCVLVGALFSARHFYRSGATQRGAVLVAPAVSPQAFEEDAGPGALALAPSPVFMDNADRQGVAIVGSWQPGGAAKDAYLETFLHDDDSGKGEKSVLFTPRLPETRVYSVYLRWPAGGRSHADNTPIVITHAGGTTSLRVNQQLGGGSWNRLGSYRFHAGQGGGVLISNTGTRGAVVADAVVFAPLLKPEVLPLTFSEEFSTPLEVSDYDSWRSRPSKWFASTPYAREGYGDARFGGAGDPPFSLSAGVLSIRAAKSERGWVSGMLSSARPDGSGFLQRFGYFEARMKFPAGMGTWPSFWLLGAGSLAQPQTKYGEIDVVEFYGNQPDTAYAASHVWHRIGSEEPVGTLQASTVYGLSTGFHTYSVLVRSDLTTWYVDGVPQLQTPTLPENREPLYMMVCYALGGGWPTYGAKDPSFTEVDYVRAYAVPP